MSLTLDLLSVYYLAFSLAQRFGAKSGVGFFIEHSSCASPGGARRVRTVRLLMEWGGKGIGGRTVRFKFTKEREKKCRLGFVYFPPISLFPLLFFFFFLFITYPVSDDDSPLSVSYLNSATSLVPASTTNFLVTFFNFVFDSRTRRCFFFLIQDSLNYYYFLPLHDSHIPFSDLVHVERRDYLMYHLGIESLPCLWA